MKHQVEKKESHAREKLSAMQTPGKIFSWFLNGIFEGILDFLNYQTKAKIRFYRFAFKNWQFIGYFQLNFGFKTSVS